MSGTGYPPRPMSPVPGVPAGVELALWPIRVQSALVDWALPGIVAGFVLSVFDSFVISFGITLLVLAWVFYNAYLNGSTGQSIGKQMAGTKVVRAVDGQLLGGGMGVVRQLLHILDSLACYLGYLWPLWDPKRQTFSDKIVATYVIKL